MTLMVEGRTRTQEPVTMSPLAAVVHLNDIDLLLRELQDPVARARLRKLGLEVDGLARLDAARSRVAATLDRRWLVLYERLRHRYGRAVAAVRSRVCLGCFVTLPTTARAPADTQGSLRICESCGRILFWG